MKQIFAISLLIFAFAIGVAGQEGASSQPDSVEAIKKEIMQVEEAQVEAVVKGDAKTLDRIYADDFAYTNQFGELIPREQVIAGFHSGGAKLSSAVKHDQVHIRIYGNTAVVTARSVGTYHYKGKIDEGPRILTNVYVKLDGRWQLVAHNPTDVAKP